MSGTHQGRVIELGELTARLEAFEHKPHAQKLVEADGANLVLLEFKAGQIWKEHHSVHPIVVQALKGRVAFRVKGETITLAPGQPLHLTAHLLHELEALEDSTVMVTMLTGESHPQPKIKTEVRVL